MRAKRKATAEYRLTVAGLTLAVATLIVVLGVDGGFADRVETARLAAGDDIVRIISLARPKVKEGILGAGRTHSPGQVHRHQTGGGSGASGYSGRDREELP